VKKKVYIMIKLSFPKFDITAILVALRL